MARKSNPQPLTLNAGADAASQEHNFNDLSIHSPGTPLSPKSPRSPKSPFRFSTKKGQGLQSGQETAYNQGDLPSLQAADSQQSRTTLPPSQNTVSLPSLQQYQGASGGPERQERERERPSRSGFFANYKASKSSSRLQNSDSVRQVTEDSMSRDTDRPAMSGKVPSQENIRTGTTSFVSSVLLMRTHTNSPSCFQNRALIDPLSENPSAAPQNPMFP